jgi:hypothetical protein
MPGCCKGRIMGALLEPQIEQWVEERLADPAKLVEELWKVEKVVVYDAQYWQAQRAKAEGKREAIQAKLDDLLLASLGPGADKTTYARVEPILVAQRTQIEEEIAGITAQIAQEGQKQAALARLVEQLKSPEGLPRYEWFTNGEMPVASRAERIRKLVERVTVHPDKSLTIQGAVRGVITPPAPG